MDGAGQLGRWVIRILLGGVLLGLLLLIVAAVGVQLLGEGCDWPAAAPCGGY